MTRPLIAVVADRKPQTSGAWQAVVTDGVPHSYLDVIDVAGGDAVLFPVTPAYLANPGRILDLADGLFLPGGRDIDAQLYGQDPHAQNDPPFTERDELELALVRAAVGRRIPVFGACRGMQLINVALGGTLEQHLADRLDQTPHRDEVGRFTTHGVTVDEATRLARALQRGRIEIASHHHQSVDELGEGLVASAFADDGVIEALELEVGYCLGVQWHPEQQPHEEGLVLVRDFIAHAAARRGEVGAA